MSNQIEAFRAEYARREKLLGKCVDLCSEAAAALTVEDEDYLRKRADIVKQTMNWAQTVGSACSINTNRDSMYDDRTVPRLDGPNCNIHPVTKEYLRDLQSQLDDPDCLYTKEDIELIHAQLYQIDSEGFMGCRREKATIYILKDFCTDDEIVCTFAGQFGCYAMRKIKLNNWEDYAHLEERSVKHWIKEHPTKQWYVTKSGELIDLAQMQELITKVLGKETPATASNAGTDDKGSGAES